MRQRPFLLLYYAHRNLHPFGRKIQSNTSFCQITFKIYPNILQLSLLKKHFFNRLPCVVFFSEDCFKITQLYPFFLPLFYTPFCIILFCVFSVTFREIIKYFNSTINNFLTLILFETDLQTHKVLNKYCLFLLHIFF